MAMGTRDAEQPPLWIASADLPEIALTVMLLAATCTTVAAQPNPVDEQRLQAAAAVGVSKAWDDEGGMGTGIDAGGSIGWQVTDHILLSAAIGRLAHERPTSFLSWDGRIWTLSARAAYGWRGRAARFWPFVAGGLGLMRSTGTITERRAEDPFDRRSPEVLDVRSWSYTGPLWEVGGGAELRFGRTFVRPEAWCTWGMLDRGEASGVPEPPIVVTRFMVVAAGVRF